jgi:hypothetical protein
MRQDIHLAIISMGHDGSRIRRIDSRANSVRVGRSLT